MRKVSLIYWICLMLFSHGCDAPGELRRQVEQTEHTEVEQTSNERAVTSERELAISVAKNQHVQSYGEESIHNIVSCEQISFWRVVIEPKNTRAENGSEYIIDKRTRTVLGVTNLPLIATDEGTEGIDSGLISTDKDTAIAITKKDAGVVYGSLKPFDLTVCELTNVWRIIFAPKEGLLGGGPEYVVDKKTGKILSKKYYQ